MGCLQYVYEVFTCFKNWENVDNFKSFYKSFLVQRCCGQDLTYLDTTNWNTKLRITVGLGSADLRVEAGTAERKQQIWIILQNFRRFQKWVPDKSLCWVGWSAGSNRWNCRMGWIVNSDRSQYWLGWQAGCNKSTVVHDTYSGTWHLQWYMTPTYFFKCSRL